MFDAALEEIEAFYGLTPRLDANSSSSVDVPGNKLNDPDLADVFTYLDSHSSRANKKMMAESDLLRLRDRPDLVESVTDTSDDDLRQKSIS
jgi:hypothetical protein